MLSPESGERDALEALNPEAREVRLGRVRAGLDEQLQRVDVIAVREEERRATGRSQACKR